MSLSKGGMQARCSWSGGRVMSRGKADTLFKACRAPGSAARVLEVTTKDKKQGRPTPLNTVALLKACSKSLGIGPGEAM